ncbi:hypothetical protein JW921_10175 [Candidatus Fermentibacterales bacterium]|nr:hypothetical protein [Candidatus Fermentibacterales bacterium]
MNVFLAAASLLAMPSLSGLSPAELHAPEGWSLTCSAVDREGRVLAGCYMWDGPSGRHRVLLYVVGDCVDSVTIEDERITSISMVRPASEGGYLAAFPSDYRSMETSVAMLGPDGSVLWSADTGRELQVGLVGLVDLLETPGTGLLLVGNLHGDDGYGRFCVASFGKGGLPGWEVLGEPGEEILAALPCEQGVVLVGRMPGSFETRAFARCLNHDGETLWDRGYDIGGFSRFTCACGLPGGFIFAGTHWPLEGPQMGLVVRADSSGNEVWRGLIAPDEGYQQIYLRSALAVGEDRIVLAGFEARDDAPMGADDAIVVLLDGGGNVLQRVTYGIPAHNHEEIYNMVAGQDGQVRLFGRAWGDEYEGTCLLAFPPVSP